MRSLLWKEWHEQSWKLAFSCILLGAMAAIGLHSRIISDSDTMIWVCLFGMLLPISYSSGLLPAERADKYFESLIALPVKSRKILSAKTVMGLALCVAPLLTAMLISLAVAGDREIAATEITALYARSIFASVMLFIWMLALTSQLPGETRASLLSVGIWICWLMISVGIASHDREEWAGLFTPIWFALGPSQVNDRAPNWIAAIAIQGSVAVLLWLWTSRRFSTITEGRS